MCSFKTKSLLLFLFPFILTNAQEKQEVTLNWIHSGGPRQITNMPSTVWLNDGTYVWYDNRKSSDERTLEKVDPIKQTRTPLLNQKEAIKSLQKSLGETAPSSLNLPEIFSQDGQIAIYLFDDDIFLLDIPNSRFSRITNTKVEEEAVTLSPDSKKLGYVRNNNLFI